jgi:hypothetical protein
MTDEQFDQILRRLDLIASLLLEDQSNDDSSLTDKAVRLESMGLSNAEIGRLLRKPPNHIAATLSMYRKSKKKKKGAAKKREKPTK